MFENSIELQKKKANNILLRINSKTSIDVYNQIEAAYDSYLTTYYEYVPKRYHRHDVPRVAVDYGVNLYRSDKIRKGKKLHGYSLGFIVEIISRPLSPYKHVSREFVLNNVLSGLRPIGERIGFVEFETSVFLFGEKLTGNWNAIYKYFNDNVYSYYRKTSMELLDEAIKNEILNV